MTDFPIKRHYLTGATADEVWPLVRAHHYSKRMPGNIQHCYAMRECGGLFGDYGSVVAAAIYNIPPTRWSEEVIELTRLVRIPVVSEPLSRLIAFSVDCLGKAGWALAVSFADWTQGHHGGIYQAAGWHYAGQRERRMDGVMFNGVFKPGRSCNSAFGTQSIKLLKERFPHNEIEPHFDEGKHLYWKPLRVAGKTKAKRLGLQSLPYPKPNAARPEDERESIPCEAGVTPAGRSIIRQPLFEQQKAGA